MCHKDKYCAYIRWFCQHAGMIYIFEVGQEYYKDPFCYTLTFYVKERYKEPLINHKQGLLEIIGLDKIMTISQYRAIVDLMYFEGWGVISTRVKNGKIVSTEVLKKKWEK